MNKKISVKTMAMVGVMTAVICIVSPFTIPLPFSPVPISLATLILYFSTYILGMKKAIISYVIYLLIGIVGIPVFSGFSGGIGKIAGPTGGYLIGYVFILLLAGIFIDRYYKKWYLCLIGLVLGTLSCYILGTIWLAIQCNMSFYNALMAGVIPFLPGDIAKIVIVLIIGPFFKKIFTKFDIN